MNLNTYGSYTKPRNKTYNRANREEQENDVLQCVRQSPHPSSRQIEVDSDAKPNTALRILQKHKIRPYKIRINHCLYPADYNRRREFCNWFIQECNQNPNFTENIIWTDESCISNCGIFNRNNNHYYSQNNPHATATINRQGRFVFSVWCGVINNHLIGPYFFHGNFTGALYIEILENNLIPYVDNAPLASHLRLELLEVPCDKNLIRALYGLLMLLPQTEAFTTLRTRLSCIPSLHLHFDDNNVLEKKVTHQSRINFQQLLNHFITVQEKHKEYKKCVRTKEISSLDKDISNIDL